MTVAHLRWTNRDIEEIVQADRPTEINFPANDMYSAFYGLREEPFRLTPDPRFLHLAEPHRNTLLALVEGVSARKGLQVSVGPIGTGKTTLLHCLQRILAARTASAGQPLRSAFVVTPTLTADELF